MGNQGRRRHLRLDGGAPRRSRSRALRRVGRVSEGALFNARTQRRAVAGGEQAARLCADGGGKAVPAADAQRPHPPLRAFRHSGRGGAAALPRLHGDAGRIRDRRVSRQGGCGLQHPDPGADAFYGPRRGAGRDRGRVGPLRGPRRDHRVARASGRRQDDARGRLCRHASRRLSGDLVGPGAERADDARRSNRTRRAPRLGGAGRKGGAGAHRGHGAAAPRGRRHPADLRQCDGCRCAEALSAARRRRAGARHLERAGLARRRRAGRDPPLAQGDRRRFPDREDGPG
jgi:hypothetical protein